MSPSVSISSIVRTSPARRPPAAKVPLASRAHVDRLDAGLTSVHGAQEIISALSTRHLVTKLILGHNDLGDSGCVVLFRFLCSDAGKKYRNSIREISLNSNNIGDVGLEAAALYLRGNATLKELFLQNNVFTGDDPVMSTFISALNTSRLSLLSLTSNPSLAPSFLPTFLSNLTSSHLHELHLSAIRLTSRCVTPLIEFITSPRCKLHTLKCNGNSLGLRGVKRIVRAIERANWGLVKVEMYSNGLADEEEYRDEEVDEVDDVFEGSLKETEQRLRAVLMRNEHMKKETQKDALCLLRYARPLLFQPRSPPACPSIALPTELILHILSFIAPFLSLCQRGRVYAYASSASTLPRPQVLRFPSSGGRCIPDPSSLVFGAAGGGLGVGGCANGRCMGVANSVRCRREEEKARFLEEVDCIAYEPGA